VNFLDEPKVEIINAEVKSKEALYLISLKREESKEDSSFPEEA